MLEIKNLSVKFFTENRIVSAVQNLSFKVSSGESFGILGESGSGKSTLALAILRLVSPPGRIVGGEVLFQGKDILKMDDAELTALRGAKISMIFQDPFTSLNPVYTIGDQIIEAIRLHQKLDWNKAYNKAVEMLRLTRISDPEIRIKNYPHQFSGGMRQRAMIAMALSCNPQILIADEPTTALDATIQAEILDLMEELQKKLGFAIIFITHNFGIIKRMCKNVIVMRKGEMVEAAAIRDLLENPQKSYTKELIFSLRELHAL